MMTRDEFRRTVATVRAACAAGGPMTPELQERLRDAAVKLADEAEALRRLVEDISPDLLVRRIC